jgi:glycosyltransferase involved in cell wall biosynthesis
MKILFTSNKFFPDIGGIETVASVLARHFVASGHTLRLVTQSVGNNDIDRRTFPFPVLRSPSALWLFKCYLWADVVIQNNIEMRQSWPQIILRRPTLIILHTWIRSSDGRRRLVDRLKLLMLHTARYVVSVSESIRLDSFPRSLIIGNPYDSSLFVRFPDITKQKSIVFLGRLVSDKGAALLLHAFHNLEESDWHLFIVGTGPEYPSLELLARELSISSRVHFLGALTGEELVTELNRHQIMVVPSLWREPFGVVALEGLACGCVVLASDGGGLADAVGTAGLLFRRGDQADLTRQLQLLLQDPTLRTELKSRAPGHLANFQESRVCSLYEQLLEKMVQHPQSSRS